jgi:hypothetical protein
MRGWWQMADGGGLWGADRMMDSFAGERREQE